jgi:hypothetical protein
MTKKQPADALEGTGGLYARGLLQMQPRLLLYGSHLVHSPISTDHLLSSGTFPFNLWHRSSGLGPIL